MSRQHPDENLFKDSTMTFGEHLGELRVRLVQALLGLVFGFVIGLMVGNYVVKGLQRPLRIALKAYLDDVSLDKHLERIEKVRGDLTKDELEELLKTIAERDLVVEESYIDVHDLLRSVDEKYPGLLKDVDIPERDSQEIVARDTLIRVPIWRESEDRVRVIGLNAYEAFMIYIKAALITGVVIASPWIFYQIWMFVAAGLYPHEKNYVYMYLPFSILLFIAGASMAFFFVFEPVLTFLFGFYKWLGIEPDQRIGPWLNFVLILPLGFGVSFQLPLVMLFLERIGVMTVAAYIEKWRIAILAIFVISMLLTPADPTSMLLMAVPLSILYVGGVLLCKFLPKRKSPFEESGGSRSAV